MHLLHNLYSSPTELLQKAERDRDALRNAMRIGDSQSMLDKVFDFSVTVYHIVDWVQAMRPDLKTAVYGLLNSDPALQGCRDIANANKHFFLDVETGPYKKYPPVVERVEYSLGGLGETVSALEAVESLARESTSSIQKVKVQYESGARLRFEDLADQAVSAWQTFSRGMASNSPVDSTSKCNAG